MRICMPLRWTIAFLIFALPLGLGLQSEAAEKSGYAGGETCKGCHEIIYLQYAKSVHGKKAISGSPANREECESCHGPGAEHAEKGGGRGVAIFAFTRKVGAQERAARCLACHEMAKPLAFWDMGRHKVAGVSCDNCHSIHKGLEKFLKTRQPDLCFPCHQDIRALVNRQSHHPIIEGRIQCLSCHNPHGGTGPKMIKADAINDLCYKCHAEKRGPYAWEHPPVAENCLYCHESHGTNHSRLLVRKAPLLCQSCHNQGSHPINPYTQLHSFQGPATAGKNKFFARSCLNCHNNIHGSNHPALGSVFIR